MMRFALGFALVLYGVQTATADDWTGKKIKVKEDVKPGRQEGAGLIRGTDVVKKGTEFTVKADDGTYLELDGKRGSIFKTEAVLASNDPNALPSDGTTWTEGTVVFERGPDGLSKIELRTKEGLAVEVNWIPQQNPTVKKDGNDGTVLLTDGKTEGWVKKSRLVPLDDVPVWAERRLKANPKDRYALRVRAEMYSRRDDHAEAIKDYTSAIDMSATPVADLIFRRGVERGRSGDPSGAITDFDEALRLDPSELLPVPYRGTAWLMLKEFAKAEKDLTEWLEKEPKNALWLPYRADARFHLGEIKKAMDDADAAIEVDPKCVDAMRIKARALAKTKKYADAKETFKKAMEIDRTVGLYADFARFLSTCPEEEHRDGMYALKIMKLNEGVHDDKHKFPTEYIEVFAAVYAEGGEFDEAVEKQTEAVKQLMADKKTPAAELKRAEKVLELYENKKPLRDE